jgi:hypothetical protein
LPIANCQLPISDCQLFYQIDNRQSAIGNRQFQWQFFAALNPAFSASAAVLKTTLFFSTISFDGVQPFG